MVALGLTTQACLVPTCPEQPTQCADQAEFSVRLPEASGADYQFEITADGADPTRCLLASADVQWSRPWLLDCDVGSFSVVILPILETDADCDAKPTAVGVDVDCGGSVSQTGHRLKVVAYTKPTSVRLQLSDAGGDYEPFETTLEYRTVKPDGDSCPAACAQAEQSISWGELTQEP